MANKLLPKLGLPGIRRLGGEPLLTHLRDIHKVVPTVRRANVIAKGASAGNGVIIVGDHPQGFGQSFIWDRVDNELLLELFINAADSQGSSILGLQPNDIIEVTSGAGIASFSEDNGNPTASSIVGLIGVGANVGLGIAGFPEAIPFVNEAQKFAQEQFKASNAKTMKRNAFGVDPGSGLKARAEGGIIISFPAAGEPYYSGDRDHKERWIKPDGTRTDDHRPDHVVFGFFPIAGNQSHNKRFVLGNNAPLRVLAWDHKFEDNAGFYQVFLRIEKGVPPAGPILL